MPRQTDKHRNIEIAISAEAVEEALSLWITKYHGIEVDRKHIEITTDEGKISVKITKRAQPESNEPNRTTTKSNSRPQESR